MASLQDVMLADQSRVQHEYNNSGMGKLAAFVQGLQQAQAQNRTNQSANLQIAKQRADLTQAGFQPQRQGGIAGLLQTLATGSNESINTSNYQSPAQKAMAMAAQSGGDYALDSFDSKGKFKFKKNKADESKGMTPYQQETLALQKKKYADQKEESRIANENKTILLVDNANSMLDSIRVAKEGINNFGFFGAIPSVPGTKRVDWETNVNKILSGKVIELMAEMKNASRTGATGFGQLNKEELTQLKNASTALKRNLRPEDAERYLNIMEEKLKKVLGQHGGVNLSGQQTDQMFAVNPSTGERISLVNGQWVKV